MDRANRVYRTAVIVLLIVVIAQSAWIVRLMRTTRSPESAAPPAAQPVIWRAGGTAAEAVATAVPASGDSRASAQTELFAQVLRASEMPWVTSGDGKLALRITSDASTYPKSQPVKVLIELRNGSPAPLWACPPNCGAWDVKIDSGGGVVPYVGPVPGLVTPPPQWLQPGEVIRSIVELRSENFTGFDNTATYHIRWRYACDSSVKALRAETWVGTIDSLPLEIQRQ